MTFLALLMTAVLLSLAGLHVLWGIGLWWPIRDERALVAAVVGVRGAERMPGPIPCALVAVALLAAAQWLWLPQGALRQAGLIIAATVFLIRGLVPWRPFWRTLTPQQPFSRLDRQFYSPLCTALGAGFALQAWPPA
jgi:hypothetical protein